MRRFIDLQRGFRNLTAKELEDPDFLASLDEQVLGSLVEWPELLKHPLVLLLAEAGSGKTIEMREQVKKLVSEDQFAFFVAIEQLDREPLGQILSSAEERKFESWKNESRAPAWFFLDAVDELKLTTGKLEHALARLSKSLDGHRDRARLVISSRPNDWRPVRDLAILQNAFPMIDAGANQRPSPDELFVKALQPETNRARRRALVVFDEDDPIPAGPVRSVVLLPLSERQIRIFTAQSALKEPAAFLAEIERQNAWAFARRPLDLSELITTWTTLGHLGTRAEQHESNVIAKLRDDPERADHGVLTDLKARTGAERLALALALTRTRTLRSPEQALDTGHADGVLDPATILVDWTEQERQVLLRRALFDPATYGRVRFHHRSVQEYLAGRRLQHLRTLGMSTKAMFRLLFAERYGVNVVMPSMRPIAAWLALWDGAVRRELMHREPEVLLWLGDAESLTLAARAELVRAFASTYASGGERGMHLPADEVRRLAHPELAPVIRELWAADGPMNPDVRELLIMMIWQGRIEACMDLARTAALDTTWDGDHRVMAVRALLAGGQLGPVREVTEAMLRDAATWPPLVVHHLAADLFPSVMSVPELMVLIERTPQPKDSTQGMGWTLQEIAQALEVKSPEAIALRDAIAELIWLERDSHQEFFRIRGRFGYLAAGLATLCVRQLASSQPDAALIRCCVIASRFADEESGGATESVKALKQHFRDPSAMRANAFWAELTFMDQVVPAKDDPIRLYYVAHGGLTGDLNESDRGWLEIALANPGQQAYRSVALFALLSLWNQRGRILTEVNVLQEAVKDDARLEARLLERTAVPPVDPEQERMTRENEELRAIRAAKEEQRLQGWKQWRDELMASSAACFEPDRLMTTLNNLYKWMQALPEQRNHLDIWDRDALLHVFGKEVTERASQALQALWRMTPPALWSTRAPEERNSTPYVWIYGLSGISSEAPSRGWASRLTDAEACIAAAYATLELNGFPSFLTDLTRVRPEAVDFVVGQELNEQLRVGDANGHLPLLQYATYADHDVKRLLAPRILTALSGVPKTDAEELAARWAHHLDQMLRIVAAACSDSDRQLITALCIERYESGWKPANPLAHAWLRGLFRLDPLRATDVLAADLSRTPHGLASSLRAIELFTNIFHDRAETLHFENVPPTERVRTLGRLVRLAWAFIRVDDDAIHEDPNAPESLQQAAWTRSVLLSALIDTPGNDARELLLQLASEPEFAGLPDRLRMLARQRAATDAEFAPFGTQAVVDLDTYYEIPPADRDGLFRIMMDRLDDLAHDLAHHDFTDRRTLRTIQDETEMQRTLSWRLETKSNHAFVITRENEVADLKRTDIRVSAVRGDQKAVIEVKLADNRWSLGDLERALRHQLVGQYLRHANCKAGCLLVTFDGSRAYWIHPDTNERLNFRALLNYLNGKANAIEIEHHREVRLAVFGLDLTDPVPTPAHA